MNKPLVGIIGYGVWGRALEKTFKSLGYEVVVSDKKTTTRPEDIMAQADVVFFCVDIWETVPLIKSLIHLAREGQLLSDVTSVKFKVVDVMRRSPADVIGLHPQGQAGENGWEGLNVSVCHYKVNKWLPWMLDVLEKSGARATLCIPQDHDRFTSLFQCVVHVALIAGHRVFRKYDVEAWVHNDFGTSLYRVFRSLVGRVLAKKADLYSGIMFNNPFAIPALKKFEEEIRRIREYVEKKHRKSFEREFKKDVLYFNSCGNAGVKGADHMVTLMLGLMNDLERGNVVCLDASVDRVGLSAEITRIFAEHNVNLRCFHSFPHEDSYRFLIGFAVRLDDENILAALKEVGLIEGVKVL